MTIQLAALPPLFPPHDPDVAQWLRQLLQRYAPELRLLTPRLAAQYQTMRRRGQPAAFSDLEGELLYCLLRDTPPGIVYEIAPYCGYSTNYILAALTKSAVGILHSFEVQPTFHGRPIEQVIRANLLPGLDQFRLILHVGDAQQTVPPVLDWVPPDFVLLDGPHTDRFAAWYAAHLFPCCGRYFIQDICFADPCPERTSEATFLLDYLQQHVIPFVPLGAYEEEVRMIRPTFPPRRPYRSSSILIDLQRPRPPTAPRIAYRDLQRLLSFGPQGGADLTDPTDLDVPIEEVFMRLDPWSQLLVIQRLHAVGDWRVYRLVQRLRRHPLGPELLIQVAELLAQGAEAFDPMAWLTQLDEALQDPTLATAYRYAIRSAILSLAEHHPRHAHRRFRYALDRIALTPTLDVPKVGRYVYEQMLRHPTFLRHFPRAVRLLGWRRWWEMVGVGLRALRDRLPTR